MGMGYEDDVLKLIDRDDEEQNSCMVEDPSEIGRNLVRPSTEPPPTTSIFGFGAREKLGTMMCKVASGEWGTSNSDEEDTKAWDDFNAVLNSGNAATPTASSTNPVTGNNVSSNTATSPSVIAPVASKQTVGGMNEASMIVQQLQQQNSMQMGGQSGLGINFTAPGPEPGVGVEDMFVHSQLQINHHIPHQQQGHNRHHAHPQQQQQQQQPHFQPHFQPQQQQPRLPHVGNSNPPMMNGIGHHQHNLHVQKPHQDYHNGTNNNNNNVTGNQMGGKGGYGGKGDKHGGGGGGGGKGKRNQVNPLVEEIKKKSGGRLELPSFMGNVVEFSRDQEGSRLIQRKLEQTAHNGDVGRKQLGMIFDEILPSALPLMTDVFGNYVIQKLLEFGDDHHRLTLCQVIKGHVIELTLQTYGCRVIQKALDLVPVNIQMEIINEVKGKVPKCVVDQNGNHVIQKCIEIVPDMSAFVIQEFAGQVRELATHPYGCRVIQKTLEYSKRNPNSPLARACTPVLKEIVAHVKLLVMNQNGNYVVQHVMTNARSYNPEIVQNLQGIFAQLSCHKFASNVAEKVYQFANEGIRRNIIALITKQGADGNMPLLTMMKDQFGNYVIQKMLDVGDTCSVLLSKHIKPHFSLLNRMNHGKHIITRIERIEQSGPNRS
eukprot:TRINITY_DN13989_c1_g1_i1.p1 TRINITY_DN13989_c1_g1~~TRINITY_DN13989_c1_g1_i1.p1  ORF type:complete len:656 (+),score=158.14 TRINITY_DN13989_c1_g1_i1:141-2108(+)